MEKMILLFSLAKKAMELDVLPVQLSNKLLSKMTVPVPVTPLPPMALPELALFPMFVKRLLVIASVEKLFSNIGRTPPNSMPVTVSVGSGPIKLL